MRAVVGSEGTKKKSPKHSAHLAETQLDHLEQVLGGFLAAQGAVVIQGLGKDYWAARVSAIAADFHLLPSQQRRLARLEQLLNAYEADTAPSLAEAQDARARAAA
jgi:hypothetical protein